MNSRPKLDQPRQWGAWLLGLFATCEERELIVGDLSEEYIQRASQSGGAAARRWYWRQILRSLPHLVSSAFRTSPWKTAMAVVVGFEFRRLMGRLTEPAIFALIDRFQIYEHHFGTYRFLASTGIDIGHLITFLMVGSLAALIARRSEMAAAISLSLIYAGMAAVASMLLLAKSHDFTCLIRLSWNGSDAFAIILGAIVVRILRWNVNRLAAQG